MLKNNRQKIRKSEQKPRDKKKVNSKVVDVT